jgi:hypothetical protein
VEGALRAFDAQYIAGLRPPDRTVRSHAHRGSPIAAA